MQPGERDIEQHTSTVYADTAGVGEALAELLGGVNVTVAESLEGAFGCDSGVLVLELDRRREERLDAATIAALRHRKLIVTGTEARWLCRELDLDLGGGMIGNARPLRAAAGWAGAKQAKAPFEPLARPQAEGAFPLGQDPRHISWQHVPEELRLEGDKGFIETLVHLDEDPACCLMARQANCIFTGVMAHPVDWSPAYRDVFRRAASWLAGRETEAFRLAIVPRQIHPPGTVRFALAPLDGAEANHRRTFYLGFDRPTVLTATLRHSGSAAAMLLFQGGPRQLHFSREDAEHGETLTVAVTVGQSAIDAMAGRYWELDVVNFDLVNGMSAELTVRYDAVGGAIRPIRGDASYEHFHRFAERLDGGDGAARRRAAAAAFGFDDWRTLQEHVAWSAAKPPEDGARMRDIYLARANAKYGESFGLGELLEVFDDLEINAQLRRVFEGAFANAAERGHGAAGVEHLLLALLDDAVAVDVLAKCGADLAQLRGGLLDSLESVSRGATPSVSRELFGALIRASLYRALGRDGANTANVLVGIFAEACPSRDLLERQGLGRGDVLRYLVFGIAKALSPDGSTTGVLAAPVERLLHEAYRDAGARRHEAFGVDHLLLALVGSPALVDGAASGVDVRGLRSELADFVATTPVGAGQPRPTRTLDSVMQRAVALSRGEGEAAVDAAELLCAIASEDGTFAADSLGRYGLGQK